MFLQFDPTWGSYSRLFFDAFSTDWRGRDSLRKNLKKTKNHQIIPVRHKFPLFQKKHTKFHPDNNVFIRWRRRHWHGRRRRLVGTNRSHSNKTTWHQTESIYWGVYLKPRRIFQTLKSLRKRVTHRLFSRPPFWTNQFWLRTSDRTHVKNRRLPTSMEQI